MKLEKFIQYLRANDWLRYLLAMACLIIAVVLTVQLIHDIEALLAGW